MDIGRRIVSQANETELDQRRAQARRLLDAANELIAMATELTDTAGPVAQGLALPLDEAEPDWNQLAQRTYRARRVRDQVFAEDDLFGEPAWDMLLDLFVAASEDKRVPVTSACIGAAVPTTTALRWLSILESRGLVERQNDTHDARRVFVRLSPRGFDRMIDYFTRSTTSLQTELRRPNGPDPLIRR